MKEGMSVNKVQWPTMRPKAMKVMRKMRRQSHESIIFDFQKEKHCGPTDRLMERHTLLQWCYLSVSVFKCFIFAISNKSITD